MGTLRRVIPELPPLGAVALRGEVGPCCTYAARGLYSPRYISLITPDPRGCMGMGQNPELEDELGNYPKRPRIQRYLGG